MKTKKLLSLLLAIVMVVSMMTTLGISASAESVECTNCNHTGKVNCGECHGTGLVNCIECSGSGQCYYCGGIGTIKWCDECDGSNPLCQHCCGDGLSDCVICEGSGICDECDGAKTFACSNCTEGKVNCFACNGTGYVSVPDECYLDLDENTTEILEKKELDQNYNLTVNETGYEDATKVKLSWEIKDINATRTDNKIWDTENLCWKTDSSSTTINQQGTAKFTLENYSSVKVNATATFKAEGNFKGTASYDVEGGKVTLDTANGNDTYSKTNVPTKVINATVTTAANDFDDKEATTKATKYGTYTVTISKSAETRTLYIAQSGGGWAVSSVTVNGQVVNVTKTRDSDGYITVTEGDEVVVSLSQERICYAYSSAKESPLDDDPSNVKLTASNSDPRTSAAFTVPDLTGVVVLVFNILGMAC